MRYSEPAAKGQVWHCTLNIEIESRNQTHNSTNLSGWGILLWWLIKIKEKILRLKTIKKYLLSRCARFKLWNKNPNLVTPNLWAYNTTLWKCFTALKNNYNRSFPQVIQDKTDFYTLCLLELNKFPNPIFTGSCE